MSAVLATLLFVAAWLPWHPARPVLPTADLYTHLSVARHLVRGEGFLNDVTYPLSFAFPFAQALPQPLINRQPGFSVVLTAPYLTAGRDPQRTLLHTRTLQLLFLGAIVLLGIRALQRHQRIFGVVPWFIILGTSPLLAFAVDWGFEELLAGGLLLALWLRLRNGTKPSAADGVLWGILILFRLELFWVPLLWWLGRVCLRTTSPPIWRGVVLAAMVALLVSSPWSIRNMRLTGHPFFTLQAQAELVKDTQNWPGYQVYRQLEPQPLLTVLRDDPVPSMRKAARGLKFFWRDSHRFFPPLLLLGLAYATLRVLRRFRKKEGPSREDPAAPALSFLTLIALCFQYAFFDHSLRHLLVLLPVLAWEVAYFVGLSWRHTAAATIAVFLPFAQLPGWQKAAQEAVAVEKTQPWLADREHIEESEIYFFEYSAGPWFLDRPGVWRSPAAEAKVPALLLKNESVDPR